MTGAIFWLTRPDTMSRSAWRGEARKTSWPQRPASKRGAPNAIISIAQQARPMVAGQNDACLSQPMTPSTVVSRTCLLYTSDAADEEDSVDLGGRRIIKKKNT